MVSGSDCPCPRRWDNSLYLVIVYHVSLEELIRPGVLPGLGALLGLGAPSDWEFSNSWGRSDADVRVIKTGGTLRDLGLGAPPGLELRPAWSSSWLESFARPGGSARPRSFSNPKEGSMQMSESSRRTAPSGVAGAVSICCHIRCSHFRAQSTSWPYQLGAKGVVILQISCRPSIPVHMVRSFLLSRTVVG